MCVCVCVCVCVHLAGSANVAALIETEGPEAEDAEPLCHEDANEEEAIEQYR